MPRTSSKNHRFSAAGASTCTNCVAGKFSNIGFSQCVNCNGGFTSGAGSGVCFLCNVGTYAASGDGTHDTADRDRLFHVHVVTVGFPLRGLIIPCACVCLTWGMHVITLSGTCAPCSAGKFAQAGASACVNCAVGYYSGTGVGACIQCPFGQTTAGVGYSVCA